MTVRKETHARRQGTISFCGRVLAVQFSDEPSCKRCHQILHPVFHLPIVVPDRRFERIEIVRSRGGWSDELVNHVRRGGVVVWAR